MKKVDKELVTFAEEVLQEVISSSETSGKQMFRVDAFTELMIGHLVEAGELDDALVCFHKSKGEEINAYSVSEQGDRIDLIVAIHTQKLPPERVGKPDVDTALKRLFNFFKKAIMGGYASLEEASPVHDMCLRIHEVRRTLKTVSFFVVTDGLTTDVKRKDTESNGIKASYHVWDIERLHRCVTSGQFREPIEVNFMELAGEPIPCLPMPGTLHDYKVFLAILRGDVLGRLYEEFGPRLLERNVRSFLQARGKVNRKIQETITEEPERFLAYNNGISVTASEVKLKEREDGTIGIAWAKDLQIVNGGQTTASIHHAMREKKGADVSKVYVQAKLSVIDPSMLDDLVPLISRYANSQNKVNEVDFFANDAFHVRIEKLSRTVWAPATQGTHRQTRWFYERARGQYQDSKGREPTDSLRKAFASTHPSDQKFTKTDLAKFENTWEMLPHFVSRGAEKNFREFVAILAARKEPEPDQAYFQCLVAKAIVFRRAEDVVQKQQFGGYRANIVTYTIALILDRTAGRIDLGRIWREQDTTPALVEAIASVSRAVHASIVAPPSGKNVTEWCKKEDCWKVVRGLQVTLPKKLDAELIPEEPAVRPTPSPYGRKGVLAKGSTAASGK
jgi:AIPR protein